MKEPRTSGKASTRLSKFRPFASGLTRQEFLRQSGAATVLAGLLAAKPAISLALGQTPPAPTTGLEFSDPDQRVLEAVQLQLFPADGNGPSAQDLQALQYLLWALEDPANIAGGDKQFILQGVSWLEEESKNLHDTSFLKLSAAQQDTILRQISTTRSGENWLSLLLYYLLESLTLDPVYGGNPGGIGWRWLEHQPGFPRPTPATRYRHFL